MRVIQHIKRSCSSAIFNAHMSGERSLEMRLDNLDLEVGDIITFVEVADNGEKTGRTLSRKVVQAERSKQLAVGDEEAALYGFMALGLHVPEFNTMRLAFNQRFLLGAVVECSGGVWKFWSEVQCWPLLIAPDLTNTGILNQMHIDKWPDGVYTLHIMVLYDFRSEERRLELEIDNSLVMGFCTNPPSSDNLDGVEMELSALMMGKAIGAFDGVSWDLAPAEYVKEYFNSPPSQIREPSLTLLSGELDKQQFEDVLARQQLAALEEKR